jgi:dTDP-4-dehydrorhamnose reductase
MKRILVTGATGTVGTAFRQCAAAHGAEVIAWDRAATPIDRYQPMEDFVCATRPDALVHLAVGSKSTGRANESWLVNYEWTSELAWIARELGVRFVFTSSVMVFTNAARGPFTPDSAPDAPDGYGYEKRLAEQRIFHQNADARVVRIGWQIGERAGSNNMIDFFERQMREHGQINASTRWLPACSFLPDTAAVLWSALAHPPGLYLVDSNTRWSFFDIATALKRRHGVEWNIVPTQDFVYDQRMQDDRLQVPALNARLPDLP